jgi:hypothetical protein
MTINFHVQPYFIGNFTLAHEPHICIIELQSPPQNRVKARSNLSRPCVFCGEFSNLWNLVMKRRNFALLLMLTHRKQL